MQDKTLKVTTVAALPLIAITVAGLLIRKSYKNLLAEFNLSCNQKGMIKNVCEKYPTKQSISEARKQRNLNINQYCKGI